MKSTIEILDLTLANIGQVMSKGTTIERLHFGRKSWKEKACCSC